MTSKKFKGQKEFTDQQVRLLNFIQSFDRKHGYAPSVREMRDKAGYSSPSMVHRDLCQLEALGFIERVSRIARGSRVCKAVRSKFQTAAQTAQHTVQELLSIPVIGRVVAGKPAPVPASDFSYFDAETTVEVAFSMLPVRGSALEQLYALEVKGDSMVEAGQ